MARLPREPGMTLCGERREAGWSFRHNVKPGTPMDRDLPRTLTGIGRCPCPGRCSGRGRGPCPGRGRGS